MKRFLFIKILIVLFLLPHNYSSAKEKLDLVVVIVAATSTDFFSSSQTAGGFAVGANSIINLFKSMSRSGLARVEFHIIQGNNVRPDVITKTLKNLFYRQPDSTLFYFVGHGYTFKGNRYLVMHDSSVYETTMVEQLLRVACGLNTIAIYDACANDLEKYNPSLGIRYGDISVAAPSVARSGLASDQYFIGEKGEYLSSNVQLDRHTAIKLYKLFTSTTRLSIASSQIGEYSLVNSTSGPYMTRAFIHSICYGSSSSWIELAREVNIETQFLFNESKRKSIASGRGMLFNQLAFVGQDNQHPIAWDQRYPSHFFA
jgi:hypothetical protein